MLFILYLFFCFVKFFFECTVNFFFRQELWAKPAASAGFVKPCAGRKIYIVYSVDLALLCRELTNSIMERRMEYVFFEEASRIKGVHKPKSQLGFERMSKICAAAPNGDRRDKSEKMRKNTYCYYPENSI
jgi:hypothetical protein